LKADPNLKDKDIRTVL